MKILPPILNKLFPFSGTFSFSRIFLFFGIAIPFSLFGNVAYHSLILKSDGSLHTFGSNSNGQLGDGTTTNKTTPTQILASGVSQTTAGQYHSLILKSDGSLHTFGSNSNGQLGDGTTTNKTTPTQILASGVYQTTAGQYHSLILKSDGSLHTFGSNSNGQLGDGTTTQRNTPTQILASGVAQIAAGYHHSLILKSDGSLHTFGSNSKGQLGDGTTTQRNTPTQILASGVAQIAAGYYHSLILKSDGSLHTFGYNSNGQLGDGTTTQRNTPTQILASGVAQIAAGYYHSLILKSDGSLHTFGYNNQGQLGDGTNNNRTTPTQILASGVSQIAAGRYHSLILKSDGSLHTFGYNNYGQLGDGTNNNRTTPTQILASGVARLSEQPLPQNDFIPIYPLNSSQLTTLVNSSSIVAGNFKLVEEMNSSNQLELRIRPVVQTNGSWVDFGANQFYRTNSSYPTLSSVLNYISSNNINAVNAPTGDTISITAPTSGSLVTPANDNLHVYTTYQSNGGGYQTPTWAYRIGSSFPSYGSPHGGTQVTGTSTKSNFLSGQSYGSKTVHVALLDQGGNLHNPPVTQSRSFAYQSSVGGYQTPSGGTQSQGGGYQTPSSGYSSPGNGYSSPGGGYSSPNSGYSFPPIYETTATLLVNNQPSSITGIPSAATGSTWYQSFTAENSAKLTKFAFVTNGSFSATADVKIREGEGITGNILHSGTWSGLGSNTNSFNEYQIANEVLLSSGQKYTIQLENQTSGGFIGTSSSQYNGGKFYYSGYGGEYGDLKMKIWGLLQATGNAIEIISPATNDQNVTDNNDTLTISYNYQSNAGGYQTPTWAYRIDSGFPGYGSPHGGTQVTGSRIKNNFLSGQSYGSKTVYVVLLDQNGNMHNPPITQSVSVNYQSSGGNYQSGGGNYQSGGGQYQTPAGDTIAIQAPGNGSLVTSSNDNLSVHITYQSNGGGYQTPTWAYKIDSGFPAYGSPHGGTQVVGTTNRNDIFNGQSYGQRQINVVLLDQNGNMHNPPITQSVSVNYQSSGGNYQSGGGNYQSGGGHYQTPAGDSIHIQSPGNGSLVTPANDNLSVNITYQSSGGGYQTPTWAYRIGSGFPNYGSPHGGTQVVGTTNRNDIFNGQSYGQRQINVVLLDQNGNMHNPPITQSVSVNYQSSGGNYQSGGGQYQTPAGDSIHIQSPGNGSLVTPANDNLHVYTTYQSNGGGYQTPTWAYKIDSGFPAYGSPHGGTQVVGTTNRNDIFNGKSYGQRQINVVLLDQNGNMHNPPITQSVSVNYQSSGGNYQSGGGNYQSGGGQYQTPAGDSIHIQSPGNGSLVTPANDNLHVYTTYQSNGGGYQTPTWAYKIDSGFPAYGSPHGGTQVVGTTNRNDIFNGQSYGQRQINVVLLDQNGNMHNPPITQSVSVNYQSSGGQYQSGGGNYQSGGGQYQTPAGDSIHIQSPGNGSLVTPANDNLHVYTTYQSNGGGYQTPTWAYKIDSGFPAYGSPHGGTQVVGTTNRNDIFNGQSYGQRQINVVLLDQNGNMHTPPITQSVSVNYQSSGGNYQSGGGNYQSGGGQYQTPGGSYGSPGSGYQSPVNGYQSPSDGYQSSGNGFQSPGEGYTSPGNGYSSPSDGYQSSDGNYQDPTVQPTVILRAPNGQILVDQIEGKYRYRNLSGLTVWTVFQNQGVWQIRTGYNSQNYAYGTDGALELFSPTTQDFGTPYLINSNGQYVWNSVNAFPIYYDIESVVNGMVTSNYYTVPATSLIGKSYLFLSKSQAEEFLASKNPKPVQSIVKSFVETISFSYKNGQFILTGRSRHSIDSASATELKVGFLISPNATLHPQFDSTQKIIGQVNSDGNFSASVTSSISQNQYFRAFAENEAGTTYGRILKITPAKETDPTQKSPSEKALHFLASESNELNGGWLENSWFGTFKDFENGWIYHTAHGWLYLSADPLNGIWAWSPNREWIWSTKEQYPFLFQANIGEWIYFMTVRKGTPYYYNYSTKLLE